MLLFRSIRIGGTLVNNRIAMAPIAIGGLVNPNGTLTQRAIDYYSERAKGGVGLIVAGVSKVENAIEKILVDGDALRPLISHKALDSLGELAESVHCLGSKIFIQLTAGYGRCLSGMLIDQGAKTISASATPNFWKPRTKSRAMKTTEVERIVKAFGNASEIVAAAGIDGIELHGHEGYLFDQFTTAIWNRRTDKYGGDLESRLRFPVEVIEAIRDKVGKNFPIIYRYGLKHYIKEDSAAALSTGLTEIGRDIKEGLKIANHLERAGVNALHIDAGCYESMYWVHPPIYQPHGCLVDMAAEAKKTVGIPIIAVGRLDTPELAEKALQEGRADIIALGRGLLADPYWPRKVKEGRKQDIRPCIGCNYCMYRIGVEMRPLCCAVNPAVGKERLFALALARESKRVLIVGGGVAGMEAARVSAFRGHKALLYEKKNRLGGHLLEASVPDFKEDIRKLLTWYQRQIEKLKVEIHLETEVTKELVKREKPDVIIMATGSEPATPETSGIKSTPSLNVINCCDLLLNKRKAGENVVVYGGGLEGCETALWLAMHGKSVTIVARHELMMRQVFTANRTMLLDLLAENKVDIRTNSVIEKVLDRGLIVAKSQERDLLNCNTLVLAIGLKPRKELYRSLAGEAGTIHQIGDCRDPRDIHHAIWEGYTVGREI